MHVVIYTQELTQLVIISLFCPIVWKLEPRVTSPKHPQCQNNKQHQRQLSTVRQHQQVKCFQSNLSVFKTSSLIAFITEHGSHKM